MSILFEMTEEFRENLENQGIVFEKTTFNKNDFIFNYGWIRKHQISMFGKDFNINISADAYYNYEVITNEQLSAINDFLSNENKIISNVEKILIKDYNGKQNVVKRLIPILIKIRKNGDYAILFDDVKYPDEGIAVTIKPKMEVVSQDVYL